MNRGPHTTFAQTPLISRNTVPTHSISPANPACDHYFNGQNNTEIPIFSLHHWKHIPTPQLIFHGIKRPTTGYFGEEALRVIHIGKENIQMSKGVGN
jgi:hypothetical protein